MHRYLPTLGAFILSLSLLSSSCRPTDAPIPTTTAIPTHTRIPSPTPDISLEWLSFDDQVSGFSFRYPPEWFVTPASGGPPATTVLSNFDLNSADPIEGQFLPGQLKIDFSLSDLPSPDFELSLEWLTANALPAEASSVKGEPTTVDSHPALLVHYLLSGRAITVIYVPIGASLYSILLGGELPAFDDTAQPILSSIRLDPAR